MPVVGLLADESLRLAFRSVVTTTWGEWRQRHPATTVLSIDTGHRRDYGEGVAYRDYFPTDRLMFEVPVTDRRLDNEDDVLELRPDVVAPGSPPVAIAAAHLARTPVFALDVAGAALVVVTSKGCANRVYARGPHRFTTREDEAATAVRDGTGARWKVTDDALVGPDGSSLPRVPAHRAFWFGWVAQHPTTTLVP